MKRTRALRVAVGGALLAAALGLLPVPAGAADSVQGDVRIVVLSYRPDAVVVVDAARGFVTQIVFSESERIVEVAAGDALGWAIVARKGAHQLYLKPREHAQHSNLAVLTDRRIYNFDLLVAAPGAPLKGRNPYFRIEFLYPSEAGAGPNRAAGSLLHSAAAQRFNDAYSMQALANSDAIIPDAAHDDGQFTYLHFSANNVIPAVFEVSDDQSESLVNLHFDGDLMVLHGIFRRLVLRFGSAAVELWNEGWLPAPPVPEAGTTSEGRVRAVKE